MIKYENNIWWIIIYDSGSVITSDKNFAKEFDHEDKMVQVDETYSIICRGVASRANDIVKFEPSKFKDAIYTIMRKKKEFPIYGQYAYNAQFSMKDK